MANLNKVFLMGNLTRNPELRYTPAGQSVAEFGLAINRQYRDQSGETHEDTCFVDVQMWGKRGEVICQYLNKGSPIFIEGRLQYSSWEDQSGQKRSRMRVVAENFEFIGGRGQRTETESPRSPAPAGRSGEEPQVAESPAPPADNDVPEDDIPF